MQILFYNSIVFYELRSPIPFLSKSKGSNLFSKKNRGIVLNLGICINYKSDEIAKFVGIGNCHEQAN